MGLLMWEKPKRARSKAEHSEISFEDGPKGGYIPNMDEDSARAWKAKVTGQKLGYPQVEIRKQAGGALMTIIVNLGDGYNYKSYRTDQGHWGHRSNHEPWWDLHDLRTFGLGMHIGLNGGGQLTVDELAELPFVLEEAKAVLNQLVTVPGERNHYAAWLDANTDTGPLKAGIEALGGKPTIDIATFNFLYFTAPVSLLDAIFKLGNIRGIYSASRIAAISQEIDDFRTPKSVLLQSLEERMRTAGPSGPGIAAIRRG